MGKIFINNFQQSWKVFMHSVCLSVCPAVHSLTLLNILQMPWILYRLYISDIALIVLKMVRIRLLVRLQRHPKCSAYGGGCFKRILTHLYRTKYNDIHMCHSALQKNIFPIKSDIRSRNIFCTSSHKNISIHYVLRRKIFKIYFNIFIFHEI